MARTLPPSASVATSTKGAKLFAPSAARNTDALLTLLHAHAPSQGTALEIASGTGQHIARFAAGLPQLHWQPTDVDPIRCHSIDAHVADAGVSNVTPATILDATVKDWAMTVPTSDLIVLVNLLHLIATSESKTLITEVAANLASTGTLILYGPFKRSGELTSEGDARFDAELRDADPQIGYKDDLDITRWLSDAGLTDIKTIEMPANNLAFIARKPTS